MSRSLSTTLFAICLVLLACPPVAAGSSSGGKSVVVEEADGTPSSEATTLSFENCTVSAPVNGAVTISCSAGGGGASPAGLNGTLQYNLDGTDFGSVTNSSVSGDNITLGGTLSGITQLNVDNLRCDGNTLSTTNTNGSLIVDPNGTGSVDIQGAGTSGAATFRVLPASGTSFFRVHDNGTIRMSSDASTGTTVIDAEYNLNDIWNLNFNGVVTASNTLSFPTAALVQWNGDASVGRQAAAVAKVNDALRYNPRSTPPVTCGSANTLGVVYTDSDSNELCFCDGTSWTGLKAGGACA